MSAPHVDDVLLHRPPMRFLDRIISITEDEAIAETDVSPANPLFIPGRGLPAYAGVEMMAQAIASIDGMKRHIGGLPPKIGFLLGCRKYSVRAAEFPEGMRLRIIVNKVFSDGEMFSFECRIDDEEGGEVARANMNVYAPHDPRKFLEGIDA